MQHQRIPMAKRRFRIGELARELKVKKFVVRFWEKEFSLQSDRSEGGQRFYTESDLQTFLLIKDLLYAQGYTIAGAKSQLAKLLKKRTLPATRFPDDAVIEEIATTQSATQQSAQIPQEFFDELATLRKKLLAFERMLG